MTTEDVFYLRTCWIGKQPLLGSWQHPNRSWEIQLLYKSTCLFGGVHQLCSSDFGGCLWKTVMIFYFLVLHPLARVSRSLRSPSPSPRPPPREKENTTAKTPRKEKHQRKETREKNQKRTNTRDQKHRQNKNTRAKTLAKKKTPE